MAKLHVSLAALFCLAVVGGCDGGNSDTAGSVQATDAPTPGGAKAATYSPAEVCFSNEAFDEMTKSFPEQPEQAEPAPSPATAESPEGAMADAKKNAAAVAVPASDAAPAAAADDSEDATEIDGIKILKGRKDYCCHSPTGGAKPIRASHTASAILKCKKHAPLGWVSKGGC